MFGDQATFHQEGGPPMNYVGIDYHKKYSHVTVIDEEGRVIRSKRLENKPEPFQEFFERLEGPSEAVLEAFRTWGVMYDLLEDLEKVKSILVLFCLFCLILIAQNTVSFPGKYSLHSIDSQNLFWYFGH
jgi:hypothetical protein